MVGVLGIIGVVGKVADTIQKVRQLYLRNKNFEEDNYRNKNFWCGVVGVLGIIGGSGRWRTQFIKSAGYI